MSLRDRGKAFAQAIEAIPSCTTGLLRSATQRLRTSLAMTLRDSMKRSEYVTVGVVVADILLWLVTGAKIFSRLRVPYEVRDELFGTTSIEWRSGFVFGADVAVPIAVVCVVTFFILRRRK